MAWILGLGAGSAPGPASAYIEAYEQLRSRDCAKALDNADALGQGEGRLIAAAAKACLAAFSNEDGLWSEAKAARDAATDPKHCFDAAVFALLDRLVRAHEAHPDWEFQAGSDGVDGAPPCPRITQLDPSHGVVGQMVTIKGVNLRWVTTVQVCEPDGTDCLAEFDPMGGDMELKIDSMPASQKSEKVCVVLLAQPANWPIAGAVFTYDPPTGAETSAPTASDPGNFACP